MSLIKWNKGNDFPLSSFVDDFFRDDFFSLKPFEVNNFFPATNIEETEKSFNIELAIPGMEKEDINVELENGLLVISAEKEESKEESDKKFTRKEYNYNSFRRSFTLPENVKEEDIVAEYDKGILKLVVPKTKMEITKTKKINVS